MDMLYLTIAVGFFALTMGLLKVCQQLRRSP